MAAPFVSIFMNGTQLLVAGTVLLAGSVASAKWAGRAKDVPVDRVIRNLNAILAKDPKNAHAHYVLGRIESLAFASNSKIVSIVPAASEAGIPSFSPYDTVLVRGPKKTPFSAVDRGHFRQSIVHYRQAAILDPKDGLVRLGLGWMLELGAPRAAELMPGSSTEKVYRDALAAYRAAYRLTASGELKQQEFMRAGMRQISLEAAEGILRIQAKRTVSQAEKGEVRDLAAAIKKLKSIPIMVTPIVIPLDDSKSMQVLLGGRPATFDLAGDGVKRRWPWLSGAAGLLVWDPKQTGRITSGQQLFGSSTWWLFFTDGYEAMRTLDDNRDGWLTGRELSGISVWQDGDCDGVSNPGEVIPLRARGVDALRVRWSERSGSTLVAPIGVRYKNGRTTPSFDWNPVSVPKTGDNRLVK